MDFYQLLIFGFTFIGLCNGLFAIPVFRRGKWYLYPVLGAGTGFLAAKYYVWYASAYIFYGVVAQWAAYAATGFMVFHVIILAPFMLLALVSCLQKIRRYVRFFGTVILLLALCVGVYGAADGEKTEITEHHDVYAENLPDGFDGLKLAQITDTHIGPYYTNENLARDLDKAHAEGAEVIMMTGDLIDDVRVMPETAKILTNRSGLFPYGIFYVRGNHELYRNPAYIEKELKKTPVHILNNRHTTITRGKDILFVVGADYPGIQKEGREERMKALTEEAFRNIPETAACIFLAHHSDAIDGGFGHHAFLTLTGHTHGLQTGISGKPLFTPFKYTRGMYSNGKDSGYVSRGNGGWFPFRFGCPRELAIFTLHKK